MRRLPALALAFAVAASSLAAGPGAVAKDHGDRGGGRGEQRGGEPGHGRGGEGHWGGGPQGWRGGDGPGNGRWAEQRGEQAREAYRGEPRYDPRNDPRYDPRNDPRNDPRYAPRRGGFLNPQSGGAPIEDPGRYRLRAAPRGYAWVRVPGGMAMVSQSTGQVFDIVPDGR